MKEIYIIANRYTREVGFNPVLDDQSYPILFLITDSNWSTGVFEVTILDEQGYCLDSAMTHVDEHGATLNFELMLSDRNFKIDVDLNTDLDRYYIHIVEG